MRKGYVFVSLLMLASIILSSVCIANAAPAPVTTTKAEYNWRAGGYHKDPLKNQANKLFADLVGLYTNGRVKITYYPDETVGTHKELFTGIQEGSLEFANLSPYVDIVPGGALNWMPWTLSSYDAAALAYKYGDGILYKVMDVAWNEVGAKQIFFTSLGPSGLANKVREIKVPDDLKRLRFRVSASLGWVRALQNMGSGTGLTVHTMPWADIYNALERGVIDGHWDQYATFIGDRHLEVNKYYLDLRFAWDANSTVMSKKVWDKTPKDIQDAIIKAGQVAEYFDFEAHRRLVYDMEQRITKAGVKITRLTDAERNEWKKKANMGPVWDELCKPWLDKKFPGQNMTQTVQQELDRLNNLAESVRQ